ncbi:MAG: single-stranded-DNA-specific exonuclease RecJ [Bacteroidetes bacterium]|nr:single-stranded-DNA-specific exonuclease RecJ [Bacteroidota bacterium]MBS1931477.1 single-stranded-DNA-specific exonuclease RecJ [Bacteroidota bacterium]
MKRRWNIQQTDEPAIELLRKSLNIHPVVCRILVQRGIKTYEEAKKFFRPDLDHLHDPWLMKDMDKAVSRILTAKVNFEKILVFGDYDVDGTTAVACLYQFLKKIHTSIDFYIPHRYREGYGISKAGIDFAKENGFTLIISLDCGIKSLDLITYAKNQGIDFIVCDHHLPDTVLPPAVAILNPKQKDCNYPYKELCGCGVGFKLITALAEKLELPKKEIFQYLDLVATAIAADIVPMTGENRVLAYFGLKKANENPNNGIKALSYLSGVTKALHINNLVFMIAPRVNAAGRMDDARKAVQMFVSEDYAEALHYAELLHHDNTDRKEADSSITEEALDLIQSKKEWIDRKSTVVFQPHWHKGVVGIVASRLIEHHYRPTVVLTQSGDFAAGSARSVPGFNLYEAIHACKEYLLGYGGHFAAAGMTLEIENIEAFRNKFEEVVASSIADDLLIPEIVIDSEILFTDIKWPFYNILCQMEPFGPDNLRPIFITKNVSDTGYSRIVKEEHVRFSLRQGQFTFTGIGFGMAEKFQMLHTDSNREKKPIDIVYKIDENEWNGEKTLQLRVLDLRISEP